MHTRERETSSSSRVYLSAIREVKKVTETLVRREKESAGRCRLPRKVHQTLYYLQTPPHHRVNAIVILSSNATRDASTFNRGRGSAISQEYLCPGRASLLFVLIIYIYIYIFFFYFFLSRLLSVLGE